MSTPPATLGRPEILARLKATGVVAVIRADDPSDLIQVARALAAGGVSFVEITLTVPRALEVIAQAVAVLGNEAVIGAGTVLDAGTAEAAIRAGAAYVVSPALRPGVIAACRQHDVACLAGAMTPTEVFAAWELGADIVKVFPAGVGGPQFLRDLKGPFPGIEMMPTGGVDRVTAPQFIRAGACAVGVGGELAGRAAIAARDFDQITRNAREFIALVRQARGR